MLGRRRALQLLAGAGLVALVGCASEDEGGSVSAATTGATTSESAATTAGATTTAGSAATTAGATVTTADTAAASCDPIPEETAGPFPGDGSNGPDVLSESDVVRRDIRSSIGSASGVAEGVPVTLELAILDTSSGCQSFGGAAVYLWHCDREGAYSMYSGGAAGENYLRGVQEADADGKLRFVTVFPGCYSGRWPHMHFEVYRNVADATGGGSPVATSQLALPKDVCEAVYATAGYEQSRANLSRISLERDGVFRDGVAHQMAALSGSPSAGYTATLTVPV